MSWDTDGDKRQKRREGKRRAPSLQRPPVSVTDLEAEALYMALAGVLDAGGALRIGRTRDGSAWAFGIYGDGTDPHTEYVQPGEDVNGYLRALGDWFMAEGVKV